MDDFPVPLSEDHCQDKYEEYVDSWFEHDAPELNTKETWQIEANDDFVISDDLPF